MNGRLLLKGVRVAPSDRNWVSTAEGRCYPARRVQVATLSRGHSGKDEIHRSLHMQLGGVEHGEAR